MHYMFRCLTGAVVALGGFGVWVSFITPVGIFVGGVMFFAGLGIIVSAAPKEVKA